MDGVLHYAARLSKEFNVIAVAVSGEKEHATVFSAYLHPKGAAMPKELQNKGGTIVDRFLSWPDFIEHATFDPTIQRLRYDELMAFSRELHEFMRDHAKLTESQKPLLVAGTLIALQNKAFALSYNAHSPEELQKQWMRVIRDEIDLAKIPGPKKDNMAQPFSGIAVHPELGKATKAFPKGVLHELIRLLNEKVWPFISIYHDFDVVGQFYGEFLRYTTGDKKALGIVLTPRHITELCALLANVNENSTVLDICAGTGGFLISAMHQMMKDAQTDTEKQRIKKQGLIGIEQQPEMFALAASNMILRGDGKANLHQGSCFDEGIVEAVKKCKCDVALLNPPFSQSDEGLHELRFIQRALDCLDRDKKSVAVAVAPMSCAISPHPVRAELLKNHTLQAVMSLPDLLFTPVGVITCLMVFEAHVPHEKSGLKTWFGYWKDDGFIKTKHRGRVDMGEAWPEKRDRWVEMFRNREVHAGESVMQKVGVADEWCAEAYMETDYETLTKTEFETTTRNYELFQLANQTQTAEDEVSFVGKEKMVSVSTLFEVRYGSNLELNALIKTSKGVNFVSRTANNNGVSARVVAIPNITPIPAGTISVAGGGSVMESFLQPEPYYSGRDLYFLTAKVPMTDAQKLFYCACLRANKYRYNYGRQANRTLRDIKIPAFADLPEWVNRVETSK